jgi:calcineurin-like phosphoesterase family protein
VADVFFTSDTHFQHRFVAGLRGFATPEEHDEAVIANWNDAITAGDTVWHLGDVGMGRAFLPLIGRLNGTIHLITGNHDAVWPGHRAAHKHQREWLGFFASVQPFARKRIAGYHVLLSHFPYEGDSGPEDRHSQYRLRNEGMWLLHGHVHSTQVLTPGTRQIHVGLDAWGLRPAPLNEVERLITWQENQGWEAA